MPNDTSALLVVLACLAVVVLSVYWYAVAGRRVFASPINHFLFPQLLFLVGTFYSVELDRPDDFVWITSILGGLGCFTAGAIFANSLKKFHPRVEIERFRLAPYQNDLDLYPTRYALLGTAIICVTVGVLFARAVGYNVFLGAVGQFLDQGIVDSAGYSRLRTSISTTNYVAAGYALQFTGVLLPAIWTLFFLRMLTSRRLPDVLMFGGLLLLDFYFLTISGARGFVVVVGSGFVLLFSPFGPLVRMWPRLRLGIVISGALVFGYYALATVLAGRSQISEARTDTASGVVQELIGRLVTVEAAGHLKLTRYLMAEPVVWGQQWLQELAVVLPSNDKAFGFGSELHAFLYNGDRSGSLGLSFWGSALYNWDVVGVLLHSLFVGFALQLFTIRYVRGERTLSRLVLLFMLGHSLALYRDPYSFLLTGSLTLLLYYGLFVLVKRLGVRQRRRVGGRLLAHASLGRPLKSSSSKLSARMSWSIGKSRRLSAGGFAR